MPSPRSHKLFSALLLLLACCCIAAAQEVVLQLKNGDRLSGKIVSQTTNQVVLTTIWSNNITIPIDWITNRAVLTAPVAAVAVVKTTNAPAAKTNVIALLAPKPIPPPPPVVILPKSERRWHYEAQVGINLQYNQQSSELYYGAFKALYTGDLWRDTISLTGNYGKADGTLSANNVMSNWRVEHDVNKSKRAFMFNAVDAGYDQIRQIHFTYDESIGAGYKVVDRPNFIFTTDSGANYQKEYFYQEVEKSYFSLRLAEIITWKVNPRLTFDEKFEFYPRLTSWSDYQLRAEGNASYKLNANGSLLLIFGMIDQYDTKPATGVSQNDLQVRSSLGLKF